MDFRVDPSSFSMEKTRKLNNLPPEQKQITEREYRECQNALKNVKKVVAAATQDGTTQAQIDACLHGKMKKELKDLYLPWKLEFDFRRAKPTPEEYAEFQQEIEIARSAARAEYVHRNHKPRAWAQLTTQELRQADDPVDDRIIEILHVKFTRRYAALASYHKKDNEYY